MNTTIRKFIPYPNTIGSHSGMTLRDYYASQAMLGLFALGVSMGTDGGKTTAKLAYKMADSMLDERGE